MRAPSDQRGLSVVELLVGSTVGLLIATGATQLFVEHLRDNRRLLLEARLHQDLRAATDLIARDLRRAGYWRHAAAGLASPDRLNPYQAITPDGGSVAESTTYSFSRDDVENHVIDLNEATGFRLSQGSLQTLTGGHWQSLTDPAVLRVTRFAITPELRQVPLGHLCRPACSAAEAGCPSLTVRRYRLEVHGESATDAAVQRQIHEAVQVRNDALSGATCP